MNNRISENLKQKINWAVFLIFPIVALCAFLPSVVFAAWTIETVAPFEYITTIPYLHDRSIAVEETTNHPHIVYGEQNLYHSYFDGTQWQHETVDNSPGVGLSASIAIDSNNKIHISYYDIGNNAIKYATNAFGSWATLVIDSNCNVYTSIAVDSNNKVHIAYTSLTGILKYATNAAGNWATSEIGVGDFLAEDPSIAVDSNNKVHICFVYCNLGGSEEGLGYVTNAFPTQYWHLENLFESGLVGHNPSLAIDSTNNGHITYTSAGGDLTYNHSYDLYNSPGIWSSTLIDNDGFSASIAVDSENKAHISYYDATNGDLKYATNALGQWVVSTIDIAYVDYTFIAIDSNNMVHIGYYDSDSKAIKYATNACPTWYRDADGDGYGDPSNSKPSCSHPAGYVADNTDCDDNDPKEYPNQTWYQDADMDGYSNGNMSVQCLRPAGYKVASELTATLGDCNDNNASINPGAADTNCNGIDENCNGTVDDGYVPTSTNCGVGICKSTGQLICQNGSTVDTCTSGQPQTEGPFGSQTCSDGLDNDCDGLTDTADPDCGGLTCIDNDGDGYGSNGALSCPKGTAIDCDDSDRSINPEMREIEGNGKDDDCNPATKDGDFFIKTIDDAPVFSNFNQRGIAIEKTTNSPHIAIGGDHLYHSYFDGTKWNYETVDNSPRVGQSASIAIDSNKKIHISYYDEFNGALKYATNAFGSWFTYIIDSTGNVGQCSSIAIDSNNKAYISYYDATNYNLKYATNASGQWVVSTIDSTGYVGQYTSIAVDSNKKIHISYYDATNADLKYATNALGQWVVSTIDSTGYVGYYSSIAIDSNNKAHISYYDATNYDLKYATNSGVVSGAGNCSGNNNWNCSTIDSSGDVGYYPSIAIDSNNKVHISYSNRSPNYNLKYATNASGTWNTSTIDAGAVEQSTSIAIDSNNKVHIGYYDWYYERCKYSTNASGTWNTSTIGSTGDVGQDSSIAVDSNNKIHISYYDATNSDLKYATNSLGQWVISTIDSTGYVGQYSSIAVDSNNKIHISYYDATNGDLKYATNSLGQWVVSTIDSTGYVGQYSSIAVDSNNKIHISYYDATNGDLKYATNSLGQWVVSTIDSTALVIQYTSTSIAIDSNNKAHISYSLEIFDFQDRFLFDLKYATNASEIWVTSTIDSDAYLGGYTSIAMDSNDKVHISYYFDRNLKYATNASETWNTSMVDSSSWDAGDYNSIAVDSNNKVYISYYDATNHNLKYATNGTLIIQEITFDNCISALCTSPIHVTATDSQGGELTYDYQPLDGGSIIGSGADVQFVPPGPSSLPTCYPYRVAVTVTSSVSGLSTSQTIGIIVKLAGDANGDGAVNILDKILVRNNFGQTGAPGWIGADMNCDGAVNILDKITVRNQFGQSGCACLAQ
jgi:hypothetical protein